MIRNRLLASACRLLPLWQKGVANPLFHLMVATPHQHCGCALPLRLSIYCQRLRKENQSHQHDSKKLKKVFYIYIPKNPPLKKLLKIGRGKGLPCPTTVVMVTDWLRPPCFKMVVGLDLDTNRHGIPIPQGWITPTTTPPPLWKGQGSQDAPRGSHRFCSESVKYHLHAAADRHPPFKNDSSASRKDTLLHLILSLLSQASAKWILYQGYIFHYKILVFYILHIRHYYLPLPIPYYKTYVIHGIIAHKQTNLFLWLEYVF